MTRQHHVTATTETILVGSVGNAIDVEFSGTDRVGFARWRSPTGKYCGRVQDKVCGDVSRVGDHGATGGYMADVQMVIDGVDRTTQTRARLAAPR